jgi:hypothetical protein
MALNLREARAELRDKTKRKIEIETAWKWASRAVAAYERFVAEKTTAARKLKWLVQATDYEHEAKEHSAEAGIAPAVSRALKAQKKRLRIPFDD